MEAAWPSYLHSFSSDLSALCQQYLADTPLEPLLTSKCLLRSGILAGRSDSFGILLLWLLTAVRIAWSRYVSWASVIGLLLGGVAYSVSPGVLLQTPRSQTQETEVGPPPIAKTSTTARLCFNTQPAQMLDELKTCPAGGGINQQDANGWTALMWSAHWSALPHSLLCCRTCVCVCVRARPWAMLIGLRYARGEDEHVFALLDAGADDAIVTKRPWYNLAVEYSEGMVRRKARSCCTRWSLSVASPLLPARHLPASERAFHCKV